MTGETENGSLPVVKALVDGLVNTLSRLAISQESIQKDMEKVLDSVSHIPEITRLANDMRVEHKEIRDAIIKAKEECEKSIRELNGKLEPVSKFSDLLGKPLSVVVLILLVISTAYGVFKMAEGFFNKGSNNPPAQNYPAQVAPTNSQPTIP